ncbi:MAG TPA: phosphoribosylformylglycinamidine cyclo-ligase [Ktedonobacteraceae bacterium]|nr:phosphoribosylformylglycinamidine cyclo-ligase [Ktedonobacteraceae bacterium]
MKALILRAPGINRDQDAAQACRLVGFDAELIHINQLIKRPESLLDYQLLVIPGGFSYGDDLGGGTLLARNLQIHLGTQLQQFIDEGRPVLGICNGFQVLVRAGLLPAIADETARATLTENVSAQFECRWVTMAAQPSPCIFTQGIDRLIESPVAHGEGQFVFGGDIAHLQARGQIPLVYATTTGPTGEQVAYPDNPNGSLGNIAGVCNERGNVFGLMPHPENYVSSLQHPQRRGTPDGQGDGLLIFKNAYTYAASLQNSGSSNATSSSTMDGQGKATAYAASGVDIDAGEQAVYLMREAVRATQGAEVLEGIGAFAGVFSAQKLLRMRQPVLVSSTDGVGTKTLIAAQAGRYDTIGYDIVNHSVNDLITQGARPLFFMDYLAVNKLDPNQAAAIVQGIAHACREAGCALLGGETAEMPDVYMPGAFDLAGTIVGVAEEEETHNGATIEPGDVILGLPSNGLHTNGYSLARKIFAPYPLDTVFPELGETLADALLRPHRSYLREVTQLRSYLADRGRYIKGIAHITGGGFQGNIARILPARTQAVIDINTWSVPPIFQLLARLGHLPQAELYRTFNMGIGMVIVLSPKSALDARSVLPEMVTIGTITEGAGVILQ